MNEYTGMSREEERYHERLQAALGCLQARDLSGLPDPTDDAAADLADTLWREARGNGDAPEALVNACYRAMEDANA